MSAMTPKYFTTSEIAKTCGVTKHTLFHYDEIGLLKPEFVNPKGYRYYTLQQCYTLEIISVLKKAGSSLKEIKDFLDNQNTDRFVSLIQQKQRELELELNRMQRIQSFLDGALQMTENAQKAPLDTPAIEEQQAAYFITTPINPNISDHEYARKFSEHRIYCEEHLIMHELPFWSIVDQEQLQSEEYYPGHIASKLPGPAQRDNIIVKPQGLYAVMDHQGGYETLETTYAALKEFIQVSGLVISGAAYEMDLYNYFTEENPDQFVIRISVNVCYSP
ncbi:MerR family transcriptional regulator [Paenibacillus sp. FSL R7-0345]|uniref:MerR family transcriptional regulator n=1 Tax=Paenibacillus sp. FSL R7-0345 TaxID=2954535 RepID=UPI00315A510E